MADYLSAQARTPPGSGDLFGAEDPCMAAIEAARRCDNLGHAFYYGYQAALRLCFPDLPNGALALCNSERGGNSPKQLQCRAEGGQQRLDAQRPQELCHRS